MQRWFVLGLGYALTIMGCRSGAAPGAAQSSASAAAASSIGEGRDGVADAALDATSTFAAADGATETETHPLKAPPLEASSPFVSLQISKFRDAVVSLPLGATGKRPVMVALHGNYDRPEWQCEVWRGITKGFPFILCPRGIPRADAPRSEDRWTYLGVFEAAAEVRAGLEALRTRFPEHADEGPVLYAAFSLGAILGASVVKKDAGKFPRVVFVEGGHEKLSAASAKAYAKAGVTKLLFGCGQPACSTVTKGALPWFEKAGVEARVANGGKVGHTYDGPVAQAVGAQWTWLVDGDPRWLGWDEH